MKIPLIWLKDYVSPKKSPEEIGAALTSLGLMLEKPIENDILDLEHRMDRSDWLSILGCARDLAAMEGLELQIPEGLVPESRGNGGVKIKVEAPDLVRRFNTRVFRGVKVKESPSWLKDRLEAYGIPSKNNIVDITNFVMVELGQPMHAQDLAKFSAQEIILRRAKKGEKITTLLGETKELDEDMLVLAEGKNLIGIGAIVGSPNTAVDESTTDIVLDAGNYNQANIRNTSRRLNIRNETSLRTEKFLHPHLTQVAIERATKLIFDLAGGDYYENEDYYPKEVAQQKMPVRYSRVVKIGGIEVPTETIKNILTALDYKILEENSAGLELEIPYFRTDVLVEDDVVSDILRIYDFKNIPLMQLETAPPKEVTPEVLNFEDTCRDLLVALEMHEHITSPLMATTGNPEQVILQNALASDQSAMRTAIYDTLHPVLTEYKKHKLLPAKLFEVGLVYKKTGSKYGDYKEGRVIEGVTSTEHGVEQSNVELKTILAAFFKNLGIANLQYILDGDGTENTADIFQDKLRLGVLRSASFTLFTEALLHAEKSNLRVKDHLAHKSFEDITLELSKDASLGQAVYKISQLSPKISSVTVTDTFNKNGKSAVTFRIELESSTPLNAQEITDLLEKAKKAV